MSDEFVGILKELQNKRGFSQHVCHRAKHLVKQYERGLIR